MSTAPPVRKCRFCASEISPAASVCPHCQRDLIPGRSTLRPASPPPVPAPVVVKAGRRWDRISLIVGLVIALPIGLLYCGEDHQRFIKFAEQRDAWHRKCDKYGGQLRGGDAGARACQEELDALTAYAKAQGWDK